jgi:signal transduction histidine kinase
MNREAHTTGPFLGISGEMSERIGSFNWNNTGLGEIATWPENLKTTVSTLLSAQFPMFLWWGAEKIQLYNDAYRAILGTEANGKHPQALGQKAEDCWQEIWTTINPLINQVFETRVSVYLENQLIPIYREGHLDEVFWTFSYSPIAGKNGMVNGLLVVCAETTRLVQTLRRQTTLKDIAFNQAGLNSQNEACAVFLTELSKNPNDAPFAILLLADEQSGELKYNGSYGVKNTKSVIKSLKARVEIRTAYADGQSQVFEDLAGNGIDISCPYWKIPVAKANILPLFQSERAETFGLLIVGVSPRQHLDANYSQFMELAAVSLSASLNHVSEANKQLVSRKAIQIGDERLRNIISEAPVAIAIFRGPEFVIELANEKVLEYWNRTSDQVMNVPLFTALPEVKGQGYEELLSNVMTTGERFVANELPVNLMRDEKLETTWINLIYDPLRDIHGQVTGIIVVCVEVTEQVNQRNHLKAVMEASQNQKIYETIIITQEQERKRIAESLHNGLAQLLYSVKLSFDEFDLNNYRDTSLFLKSKQTAQDLLMQAIEECRRISHELTPMILEDFGLKVAVESICKYFSKEMNIKCEFTGFHRKINKYIEITIFRTIQELVMNVFKHANASEATVKIEIEKLALKLTVMDNGSGLNNHLQTDGIGLKIIKNKINMLNGTFRIVSESGIKTMISIRIPLLELDQQKV